MGPGTTMAAGGAITGTTSGGNAAAGGATGTGRSGTGIGAGRGIGAVRALAGGIRAVENAGAQAATATVDAITSAVREKRCRAWRMQEGGGKIMRWKRAKRAREQ